MSLWFCPVPGWPSFCARLVLAGIVELSGPAPPAGDGLTTAAGAGQLAGAASGAPERPDGLYPPTGADLLALLGASPGACTFAQPRGRWRERVTGAAWAPGLFPGDAARGEPIALTFDDGPDTRHTQALLDELDRLGVRATFFVQGAQLHGRTWALLHEVVRRGHGLGNHAYQHDVRMAATSIEQREPAYLLAEFHLTQMRVDLATLASSRREFEALEREVFPGGLPRGGVAAVVATWRDALPRYDRALRRHGYAIERPPQRMLWARPPGGNPWYGDDSEQRQSERIAMAEAMEDLGLYVALWDVDTRDWWYVARVEDESLRGKPVAMAIAGTESGVVLMHDRVPLAGLVAGVELLRAYRGARFVVLDELGRERFGCSPEALAAARPIHRERLLGRR